MSKSKQEKYRAVDSALYTLKNAGYSVNDTVYTALIAERARLEKETFTRVLNH